jgi:hypothetical protein
VVTKNLFNEYLKSNRYEWYLNNGKINRFSPVKNVKKCRGRDLNSILPVK